MSIPVIFLATFLMIIGVPIWLPVCAVADLCWPRAGSLLRTAFLFAHYLAYECAGLIVAAFLWMTMSWRDDRKSYLDAHFRLQRWWATGLMNAVRQYYEVRFEIDGQETLSEGPYLLWMRHCSLLDTLVPAMLTAPFSIRLRYVLKQGLLIDPCLDIVGQRLPNCFVQRDGQDTEGDIGRIIALREELGPDDAIMLYPEGTRFAPDKRHGLIARLREAGEQARADEAQGLRHLLPAQRGGPLALLRDGGIDVVFAAHVGFEDLHCVTDLMAGALVEKTIKIRLHRVPHTEIPGEEERPAWLAAEWQKLDDWLDEELTGDDA